MSNQIVEQPSDSSKTSPSLRAPRDSAAARVEIVRPDRSDSQPNSPRGNQDYQGVGVFPEQQETVISKQPRLSSRSSSVQSPPPLSESTPVELGRALKGKRLEHFQLEEFVGGGGMGAVFRATDEKLDRTVALKVLSRDRTDPDTLRRFQNEAQSAARLDHENIARVYYVGEDEGLHFIVFEFIEGINIRDLVEQKGPLPLAEALSYVLQVAEALEHASQRSVVHRDIKPSNILITSDGRAKLVDMGLARLRHLETDTGDLTASGVTLGTFDYISPEQARDPRMADVRSDLYSLGCTLYFMLTSRPPFPEGTVLQKLLSHSSEDPSDPRHVRPDLDEQVVRIINKLLAKQPSDRYQQPSELIGELLLLADRLNLAGIAQNGAVWTTPRRSLFSRAERILPWLLPIVALPLLVFALDRFWTHTGTSEAEPRMADFWPSVPQADRPVDESLPETVTQTSNGDQGAIPKEAGDDGLPEDGSGATAPESEDAAPPASVVPEGSDAAPEVASTTSMVSRDPSDASETLEENSDERAGAEQNAPTPDASSPTEPDTQGPAAPQPAVQRIIVGTPDAATPEDAIVLNSLASACLEAASLGIATIELHFNGARQERPFDIASQHLTIRNGEGFQPTVVFRPSVEDLSMDRRMIRIAGGQSTWQNVHVQLELPPEPADDWCLFDLEGIESLNVDDSVITVRNADGDGGNLQDRVAVFRIHSGRLPRPEESLDNGEIPIPPYIGLSNCFARGQATLVRAPEATPFRIVCRQCLLITSERLIDVEGRRTVPDIMDGPVDVVMKNVTAVVGKGACLLSSDDTAPHQLDLVTDCRDSIFVFTDSDAPFIERRGVAGIAEVERRLFARGRDNFYLGANTLLRINPTGAPSGWLNFSFQEREEQWSQEQNPRFSLLWGSSPPEGVPVDRQAVSDYLLDSSEQNPAIYDGGETRAGVDPTVLPAVPEDVTRREEEASEAIGREAT